MPMMAFRRPVAGKMGLMAQAAVLLALAASIALGTWLVRSPRLSLRAERDFYEQSLAARLITVDQALQMYDEGSTLFVDTRPVDLEQTPYIPGALAIRADSFADDLVAVADFLFPDDFLVLYGTDDLQAVSSVAARFQDRGYQNVSIMAGGVEAWRRAGGDLSGVEEDNLE